MDIEQARNQALDTFHTDNILLTLHQITGHLVCIRVTFVIVFLLRQPSKSEGSHTDERAAELYRCRGGGEKMDDEAMLGSSTVIGKLAYKL